VFLPHLNLVYKGKEVKVNGLVWKMTEAFLNFAVERVGREQVQSLRVEVKVNVPAVVVMGLM
jgi:hypothetical protein